METDMALRRHSTGVGTRQDLFVEVVPLDALRPDPANPRRIPDATLDRLRTSLSTFGFVQPILARRADRTIVAGHQRLAAARREGLRDVPVIWLDLGQDEARALGLALNRIEGEWDEDLLARLLADLATSDVVDVLTTGFDEAELARYLSDLAVEQDTAKAESFDIGTALLSREDRVRPGDRWTMGSHVLVCGDATKPEVVERALGGGHAVLGITDPPYNVRLGAHGGMGRLNGRRPIANDALRTPAWRAFCGDWVTNVLASVDGPLYVFMAAQAIPVVATILEEAGAHWSDYVVWRKDRFTPGRADYQRSFEMIWYGWRTGAPHPWHGGRRQSDVWEVDRPARSPLHPTAKPLELVERAIANSSKAGDLVLDLFGGSGTTLIACQRTQRRAALVELDPQYCAVTLARWEAYTGHDAVLAGRGTAVNPARRDRA